MSLEPITKKQLLAFNIKIEASIRLIDPADCLDMVKLEKKTGLMATDSDGVPKGAYFYKVSCITLRDETKWVKLVGQGVFMVAILDGSI